VINICEDRFNVFEHYKVDKYLAAFGLLIHPDYRGRGIGTELLKARTPLMKVLDLEVTLTAFSGIVSQSTARKAGFQDNVVLVYEDLHKIQPGLYFPGIQHKYFKLMSRRI
jgi:GNAT superfamily N-acetyltransferase